MRSRASRIARTVLAARDDLKPLASHDIHEQIAAEPNLVRYMFGSTNYRALSPFTIASLLILGNVSRLRTMRLTVGQAA